MMAVNFSPDTRKSGSYPWHAEVAKGQGPTAGFPRFQEYFDISFEAALAADGWVTCAVLTFGFRHPHRINSDFAPHHSHTTLHHTHTHQQGPPQEARREGPH